MHRILPILFIVWVACGTKEHPLIVAASAFTQQYSGSNLAKWNIHAYAAGERCDVLLLEIPVILDIKTVEALHYGAEPYAIIAGGVEQFRRLHGYRAVVYRDVTSRVWPFGEITEAEGARLLPCR
ncbi:MAG: hypothetical protein ACLGH0_09110 [Thermoanaerobaculia bacterium]